MDPNVQIDLQCTEVSRLRASKVFPNLTHNTSRVLDSEVVDQMVVSRLRSMVHAYSALQDSDSFTTKTLLPHECANVELLYILGDQWSCPVLDIRSMVTPGSGSS
jgi:hypothetical protein